MPQRRRGRGRLGAGTVVLVAVAAAAVLGVHAVLGTDVAGFVAGVIVGASAGLAVARPRLSLRVSTRGTRARPLGRRRP
jgi:hypothetical protein